MPGGIVCIDCMAGICEGWVDFGFKVVLIMHSHPHPHPHPQPQQIWYSPISCILEGQLGRLGVWVQVGQAELMLGLWVEDETWVLGQPKQQVDVTQADDGDISKVSL